MINIDQISYNCTEEDCGRKFPSKDKLIEHYKNRHPDSLSHILDKEKVEEKPNSVLLSLYSKINSLEEVVENELKQQFNFDEMPNYDILNSSSEENNDDDSKKKAKDDNTAIQPETKGDDINLIDLPYDINENTSTTVIDRCSIITNEMIELGSKYPSYVDITDINLSRKNISVFRNGKNISFSDLSEVTKLNLSFNWIKYSYDIRFLNKLQQVYLNDNKIDDLTFCESLPELEILGIENNEVSSITPLMSCPRLQILKLAQNRITYEASTLKTIYSLKNLRELTIVNNPFLDDILGYRHLFIYKFPFILVLDKVDIEDVDRDVAKKFTFEHNPTLAVNRPNSSRPTMNKASLIKEEENEEEASNEDKDAKKDILAQTQTQFRVGHTIITKQPMPLVKKTENNNNLLYGQLKKKNLPKITPEAKEIKDLKNENEELKHKVIRLEKDYETVKLELENLRKINEHNEEIIRNYEEREQKLQVAEKETMKQRMELWKREYCELLDKTLSTSNSNNNNYSTGDKIIEESKPRPQTANIKMIRSADLDKIIGEFRQIKKKNIFEDLLSEESSEEEDNNKIEDEEIIVKKKTSISNKEQDIKKEKIEEDIDDNEINEQEEDDDDLDDLLRKSYQDLQFVKKDLKSLNEVYDDKTSSRPLQSNPLIKPQNKPISSTIPSSSSIKPIPSTIIIKPSEHQSKPKFFPVNNIKLAPPTRTKSIPITESEDHPKSQRIPLNK